MVRLDAAGVDRARVLVADARLTAAAALLGALLALSGCSGSPSRSAPRGAGPDRGGYAIVQRGDTLYSIAFRNNLDYHDVAAWNHIGRDYTIYPGQRLRLTPPRGAAVATSAAAGGRRSTTPPPAAGHRSPVLVAAGEPKTWRWPTNGRVVRGFDPNGGSKGIDIGGEVGQTVVAAADGKVVYSGSALKGYGELIIVKHSEHFLSAYGYNRRRLVEEGQWVRAGQPIAELGEGPERKPELHFEIRDNGVPMDPQKLLPPRASN
ncbi:MAG: peptidoglycan DD-metalloendopeptidase family protein [Gammaproteobacteria bacterium]|nr:peptidoglycan DD-metalloendopeptidase family protein [Gammaproteobacteria bacterium]